MIKDALQNLDAIDIINNIKRLKSLDLNNDQFIQHYLEHIHYFLKANSLVYFKFQDEQIDILHSIDISQKNFNMLLPTIIGLTKNALTNHFSYEKIRVKFDKVQSPIGVAFPIQIDQEQKHFIFFVSEYEDKKDLNSLLFKTQFINDIPQFKENDSQKGNCNSSKELQYILNLSTELLFIKNFKLCCNTLVNDIAIKFDFDKVSIGFYNHISRLTLYSISHLNEFEKNNTLYDTTINLYEESIFQDEDIVLIDLEEPTFIIDDHKQFFIENGLKTLVTFPIRLNNTIIGAIQGYSKSKIVSEQEILLLRLTINKITPILQNNYENDRSLFYFIGKKFKDKISTIFTTENILVKSLVTAISLFIIYIFSSSWIYNINATATLNTDNKAIISSPLNGTIDNIFVKIGDKIAINQKLFSLDTQELQLKELELKSDIVKYRKEQEKFMSEKKLADMEIAQARVQQSINKLKSIEYNIQKSTKKATISGVIVKGEKEKLLGMPINQGDTVFQISNSTDLFLEIRVLEDDIYHIKTGQTGKLVLLSDPFKEYIFKITKIIPQAKVDSQDGNVYVVYAILEDEIQQWWHPGMNGVVKIDTGSKNIFWIMTHKLFDFLKLYFW